MNSHVLILEPTGLYSDGDLISMVYPFESWSCFHASSATQANYNLRATHFSRLLPWQMLNFGHISPHFFNLILYVDDRALGKVSPLTYYCQCIQDAAETGGKIRGLRLEAA